jgi:peptide/nickel transport system substrate-binding protein
MVNFDFGPNGASLALAATRYPKQLTLTPSGGTRYVALNTSKPPFNNINVRRAVIAAADRVAMVATRGGPLSGAVATHFIPPGVPGFQQAGGYGPPAGLDFMAHPSGDLSLAESYMKLAGYTSGMCTGSSCTVTMVNDDTPPGSDTAQVVKADLVALGFNVQSQPVGENVMYSRFCSVVANEPNICPNVGWVKDFNDGQAMIDVPFNGATTSSSPNYNSNWPQLNDPAVNSALDAAKLITSRPARAVRYGAIDDLIMADAPAIPWDWDYQANVSSANVIPVINDFNGLTDLSYTSLR